MDSNGFSIASNIGFDKKTITYWSKRPCAKRWLEWFSGISYMWWFTL